MKRMGIFRTGLALVVLSLLIWAAAYKLTQSPKEGASQIQGLSTVHSAPSASFALTNMSASAAGQPSGQILTATAREATQAAAHIASLDVSAVPKLVSQLSDGDFGVRIKAGAELVRLGSNASPAVPAIQRLLETEPEKVHDVMLKVLENCGPAAQTAIPTLQGCLTSSNAILRLSCARALWVLDQSQADMVRPLAETSLTEANAGMRIEAASLLWRMDKDPKDVVPTLAALLSDADKAYDYRTITLLGQIGPPAKEAIPALKDWLRASRSAEAYVIDSAVKALQAIEAAP